MARKRRFPASAPAAPVAPVASTPTAPAPVRPSEPERVRVIYSPPGGVKRHYVRNAPSRRVYYVPYQEPFEINVKDMEWFFTKWAERQWLRQCGASS